MPTPSVPHSQHVPFSLTIYHWGRKSHFPHPLLFNLVFCIVTPRTHPIVAQWNKRRNGWQPICITMSSSCHVSVTPATPTQSFCSSFILTPHTPTRTSNVRRPLNPLEFGAKQPLQEDKIFVPFKAALQEAKTLILFVYKADCCQGKLVPIP